LQATPQPELPAQGRRAWHALRLCDFDGHRRGFESARLRD
jgi:hypothetical protein